LTLIQGQQPLLKQQQPARAASRWLLLLLLQTSKLATL
jgi:hypothetical protein